MLNSIHLKNFLSYEDVTLDLSGADSISIAGDNGAGKSALLESIVFGYYGIGRYQYISEFSRLQGDGDFSVELDHASNDMHIVIKRGLKNGKGFATVQESGETVARGSTEVADYVKNMLGMDESIYLLTAYFGLSDHEKSDPLLNVPPSKCLDTLQDIAEVAIYSKFLSRSKAKKKTLESAIMTKSSRLDTWEESLKDSDELSESMDSCKAELEEVKANLTSKKLKRDDLVAEEDAYIAYVNERDALESQISVLKQVVDDIEDDISTTESQISKIKRQSKKLSTDIRLLEERKGSIDVESLQSQLEKNGKLLGHANLMRRLKEVATTMDTENATCPLCETPIDSDIVSKWMHDLEVLDEQIEEYSDNEDELAQQVEDYRQLLIDLQSAREKMHFLTERADGYQEDIVSKQRQLKKSESEIGQLKTRLDTVEAKIGDDYDDIVDRISEIGLDIESDMLRQGQLESRLESIRDDISDNKERIKNIKAVKKELKGLKSKVEAVSILVDGFSRYGIPKDLLVGLVTDIEDKATQIYQEFDNGQIVIEDVEGAKPGVRFVLSDRKGVRPYRGLSLGEKVMFFVSVRVAVARIIAENNDIDIDLMVLDEGLGNLSPQNRDNLIRLINKILRKMFPRIAMVSHTVMADIFSRVFKVAVENDVSTVEVC